MIFWKLLAAASIFAGVFSSTASAAPARPPVTTEEFVTRCKTDARFCKIQIMAAEALLEKNHKACLPANVTKDAMAARIQDVVADVLEEDPDSFKSSPYRQVVDQLIDYLWPCEPIS